MIHDLLHDAAYMAHGYCLLWKPWLVALHAISDITICAAYFAIPGAIWIFLKQRPELPLKPLAVLFAAFILLCGFTHMIEVMTLWLPIYEIQGAVKFATAMVSVATAVMIFPLIPAAVAIPSPVALQQANDNLRAEIQSHNATLAELRNAQETLEERVRERTKELEASKARFEALVRASAQIVWATAPDGQIVEDSPTWRAFTGQNLDDWLGAGWLNAIHPDDRELTELAWSEAVETRSMYQVEYRLKHRSGDYHWTAARGVAIEDGNGKIIEWVGTNEDIDDRKKRDERLQTVMNELSHRTKNLLAVIQSIARRSFKGIAGSSERIDAFQSRLQGLAVSHDLLVAGNWSGTSLRDLVEAHLQPFASSGHDRWTISGPEVWLKASAAQSLGLALHELATNAAKHGVLLEEGGQLTIDWDVAHTDGVARLELSWTEKPVRPLTPARPAGFGSQLLNQIVAASLGGTSEYRVATEGVSWRVSAPLADLWPDRPWDQRALPA